MMPPILVGCEKHTVRFTRFPSSIWDPDDLVKRYCCLICGEKATLVFYQDFDEFNND